MSTVTVTKASDTVYRVTVTVRAGQSVHDVTVLPEDVERYASGASPERLVEMSFEFLLAREPQESILSRFELPVIERYFPDYPRRIRETLRTA